MTSKRSLAALGVLGALACLLAAAGCGRPGAKGGRPGAGKTLTIAVIPIGTTHEFWKSVHAGAAAAARDCGVSIIWKGPLKEDDRNEQIQIVETLAGAGINAIVLSPMDTRALVRPVLEAKAMGIPTIIFNSALDGGETEAFIATDNYRGGVIAAEHLGNVLGGRGNLIVVRLQAGVEGTAKREEGFLATVRAKFPGIAVLSENQYAGPSTEGAYQTMENLLARFPRVDALFTPNESTTFGCLRALQDRGLAGKIVHVGFDSSAKLLEALRKREIRGLVLQDPFRMGYLGVRTAVAKLRGEPFEKNVATDVVLATPENLDEPAVRRLLEPVPPPRDGK